MEIKNYPKISVITPSFNQGEYLEETILSVLNQNYPNIEYIIIDGGSKDKSVEIIKKYDKYIYYWQSQPDKGQSNAINLGFKIATGDILCWLNSDDTFLPGALFQVAEIYKKHKFEFYYSDIFLTNENNIKIKRVKSRKTNFEAQCYGFFAIPQQGSFWTKKVLDEVGYLNEENKTCMDGEFFIKILKNNNLRIFKDNYPIANFRIHSLSLTGSHHNKIQYKKDRNMLINKYLKNFSFYKKFYYNYIYRFLISFK